MQGGTVDGDQVEIGRRDCTRLDRDLYGRIRERLDRSAPVTVRFTEQPILEYGRRRRAMTGLRS